MLCVSAVSFVLLVPCLACPIAWVTCALNIAGKETTGMPPFVREKHHCGGVLFSLGVQVRSNARAKQVFCYQLKLAAIT